MPAFFTILPLLRVSQADLDGPAAVQRAGQILHELGFDENLTVTKLINGDWSSKEPSWTIECLLVWRATKITVIRGKHYGTSGLRMFIDALTGEFIEPDDPLWGADP